MLHNKKPVSWLGCGTEFYPEQWPERYWDAYIEQMRKAGIEYVRLFEFAWGALEPEMDEFQFDWAERVLEKLDDAGIRMMIGTPSAGAPRWMLKHFPDAAVVGPSAGIGEYASRRNICPSHSGYRKRVGKINRLLARRWGRRSGLIAWQVDNELGHPECRCLNCRDRFVQWLRERFDSEKHLTNVCGLSMWSHQLRNWQDLEIPTESHNPALRQLFREWNSQKWLEFAESSYVEIREHSEAPIFVNMMLPWHGYDHFQMAEKMDAVVVDFYSNGPEGCPYATDGDFDLLMSYARALSSGAPFWIGETQAGGAMRIHPRPGAIQDWALRMLAHGANAITYFRWETPCFGGEELEYGVVGPGPYTDRIYEEVSETITRVRRLRPLLEESVPERATVAIYFNYQSWWKNLDQIHPPQASGSHGRLHNYICLLRKHFEALSANGWSVDLCGPGDDLSAYRLLVVPQLVSISNDEAAALSAWTENGGVLLLAEPGFSHDEIGVGRFAPYPAPEILRTLVGVRHGVGGRLIPGSRPVMAAEGKTLGSVDQWAEQIEIEHPSVRVLAGYANDECYSQWPALTMRQEGKGQAALLGCMLDDYVEVYRLLKDVCKLQLPMTPTGWWIRRRLLPDGRHVLFQKNMTRKEQVVRFDSSVETEEGTQTKELFFKPGELKVYLDRSASF